MPRSRLKRILFVGLGILAVLVILLLLPPVQTALVRSVASGIEGTMIDVGRVSAGPWGGEVEGLRVQAAGLDVTVERAEADIAFWSSLGRLALDFEQVSASGVDIHLGPFVAQEDEAVAEPFEFRGLAPLARVPRRVVVRSAKAEGTVTVTATDTLELTGPWSVTVSNVGPNRRLEGALESTLEARRQGRPRLAAVVDTALAAEVDRSGAVRRVAAAGGIHSLGDEPVGLDADLELELQQDSESYRLTVDDAGRRRLLEGSAQFGFAPRVLEATWEATLTPGLVAAFARGRALPELWGESTGLATLDLDAQRLELDTVSRFEGRNWAEFDERLAEVKNLVVEADVAGVLEGGRLDARRLRIAMIPEAGREILRLEALQPVMLGLDHWNVVPETWSEPALRIELDRFPLRWTRGFDPAVVVEDGAISAALDVVPMSPRDTVLATHEPIRARDLRLSAGDSGVRPPPLEITIVPRIALAAGVLEAAVDTFEMTVENGLRVEFSGGVTTSRERWPVLAAQGDLELRLPRLQRAVESLDTVRGSARFELDLSRLTLLLDRALLDVTDVGGRSLVSVAFDNETPLAIALPSMTADWEGSDTQELRVRFDGLPIGWVSPYIPELDFGAGALYGDLVAVTGGGRGLILEPAEPFQVRGLRPLYRGVVMTADATVSLEPRLRLDNESVRGSLDSIEIRTPSRGRLDGRVVLESPRDGRNRIATELRFEGEFPALSGRIGRLGALSWRQRADIDVPHRRVEVSEIELGLTDLAGTQFLKLEELRPFVVSAEPFGVFVDHGSPDILLATITPLELQQLFPQILGFQLEGVLPQGQFVGRAENGGLLLVAEDDLVFRDVSVRWEEAALLDRVTVGLTYEVLYSAEGLQARSIDFSTLGPRGTPIADATLRAVMPLTDRTTIESLHFETIANLEPLTRQPIFTGLPAFLEGTVGGSVDLRNGDPSTLKGTVQLRGARVEDYGSLPDLDAGLDVLSIDGESLEVRAPLSMSSDNGRSDFTFEGDVRTDGDGYRFHASVTGDRLVAADVTRLVYLVSPPDPDSSWGDSREPAVSAFRERWSKAAIDQLREQRHSEPFWGADVSGDASLEFGALELARTSIDGIRGRIEVDRGSIEMTGVEASTLGARFSAEGGIRFDGSLELPYTLQLDSSFDGLDLGALFRTVTPDEPPTLEGMFEVRTSVAGTGRNPIDLGLATLGDVHVSGRDGVFRGLAGRYGLARTGTKVLGFLTFSKQLKAVSRLLGELEALEFSSFDLVLARETPRRFAISELTVVSPLARIEGTGGVEVEPGVPLVESSLDVSLDMSTQGDMTILFNGLGLLQEGTDEHGYRPLTRPITVGGTVAEPDTSEFYEMLNEAATDSKGVLGVGMKRVNKKLQKERAAKAP